LKVLKEDRNRRIFRKGVKNAKKKRIYINEISKIIIKIADFIT